MRHILIIGGFAYAHSKFNLSNFKLTIIVKKTLSSKILSQKEIYHRIVQFPSNGNIKEIMETIKVIDKFDKIDDVINFCEQEQELTSLIRKELGKSYHSKRTLDIIYDKSIMRSFLLQEKLDNTRYCLASSKEDIIKFINKVQYPIVLKPVIGLGSSGVSVVNNEEQLYQGIDRLSSSKYFNNHFYVEEFISGEEFSVEAISYNGVHNIICITKKFKSETHCVELGHCLPANLSSEIEQKIIQYTNEFLTKIGIIYGGSHSEIIVDQNNNIHIVETHCRLGGDYIPELIYRASNIDLFQLWTDQTLDNFVMNKMNLINKEKFACIWFVNSQTTGIIDSFPEIEHLLQSGADISLMKNIGDTVSPNKDSFSRIGQVICTGDNYNELIVKTREIAEFISDNIVYKKVM